MTQEQETKIRNIVKDYFYRQNPREYFDDETVNHVVDMGTAILTTKWGINDHKHGSFVNAVVENKLTDTYSYADSTNVKFIHFYVLLMYNVGMPSNL